VVPVDLCAKEARLGEYLFVSFPAVVGFSLRLFVSGRRFACILLRQESVSGRTIKYGVCIVIYLSVFFSVA